MEISHVLISHFYGNFQRISAWFMSTLSCFTSFGLSRTMNADFIPNPVSSNAERR
jgi:hypothetical protein